MQKLYAFAGLILLCLLPNFLFAQNEWAQFPDFPGTARDQAVGLTVGEFGLVGLGFDGTSDLNDFWKFDPATNSWTQIADFPGAARRQATAFSIDGKAYIGLGRSGPWNSYVIHKDFYEYNLATDSWTQIAEFAGSARYKALAYVLDGKGYVTLGSNDAGYPTDVFVYDPASNSWAAKANFGGSGREGAFVFNFDGSVYIGSGFRYENGSFAENDFYKYDATTDSWTEVGIISGVTLVDNIFYFSLDGKGYFGGGSNNKVYAFDPTDNSFSQVASFGTTDYNLSSAAAFAINARAYLATGRHSIDFFTSEYTKDVFAFASDFVKPEAPDNMNAQMLSKNELEITWRDNADIEAGYKIYLSLDGTSNYTLYATLPANTTSFIDKDFTPTYEHTRYYMLVAYADLESSSGKVQIRTTDPFKAPSGLTKVSSSPYHIEFKWADNASIETGYVIERKSSGEFVAIKTVEGDVTHFSDETVVANTLDLITIS